jgi:phosphatidylserine decarboxylase
MKPRAMREAKTILLVLAACWLIALALAPPLAVLLALLLLFTLYFFRDPERIPPSDPSLLVAPADGTIVEITEVEEQEFLRRRVVRVGIFLSIFDVHVNRSPLAGEVMHSEPREGIFLDARNPDSSARNARRTWIIRGEDAEVAVRQITGAIARRIIAWSKVGDRLQRGERFGMIRFGSRTELDLPVGSEILVKLGDTVRGGETAVARLNPPASP